MNDALEPASDGSPGPRTRARAGGALGRMRGRRPTSGGYALLYFVAFVLGAGIVGRTLAGLAGADGVWFHAARVVGFGLVVGPLYLALPTGLTEPADPPEPATESLPVQAPPAAP
ncbi:hypothetical protein AB0L40_04125 [Patulibacter sp. NPDC049589]|uniref:hypothetical protein n=1 Tax=Patulibacter sp. NPDC049589 TaxID=3154731 RepID=UPI0034401243